MIKRTMPAAIAAALAFAALPALASAGYHIDDNNGVGFTVHGEAGEEPILLTGTDGEENTIELSCETVTGNGNFTDNKKGTLQLHFQGCAEQTVAGFACNSEGQGEGEITTTQLAFELVTADHPGEKDHAVLIKPHEGSHFASFECFIIGAELTGNGIIGTVQSPETNKTLEPGGHRVPEGCGKPPHTDTPLPGGRRNGIRPELCDQRRPGDTYVVDRDRNADLQRRPGIELQRTNRPTRSASLRQRGRRRAAPRSRALPAKAA